MEVTIVATAMPHCLRLRPRKLWCAKIPSSSFQRNVTLLHSARPTSDASVSAFLKVAGFQRHSHRITFSVGTVGQVTIDSAGLTPSNFDFTSVPTSFIDAFSLTFFNFPDNGPTTFTLANPGAAFINTDSSGQIIDFNFWPYDRIGLGANTWLRALCRIWPELPDSPERSRTR